MLVTRRVALLLAASVVLTASPALAGGFKKKTKSYIDFINNSSVIVGVSTDGTNAGITGAATLPDFLVAGGHIVNVASDRKICVPPGTYTVYVVDATLTPTSTPTFLLGGTALASVVVTAGNTTTVTITGTVGPLTVVSP